MALLVNSVRHEIIPVLPKWLPENSGGGYTGNSFFEASIALIPKLDKDIVRKEATDQCVF